MSLLRVTTSPPRILVGTAGRQSPLPDFATLMALADAVGGGPYLPGGRSASESLVLMAIQAHRYESVRGFLEAGRTVIEQRGVYTAAVEDGLGRYPDDLGQAHGVARRFVEMVADWRPLPDMVVLNVDDPDSVVDRLRQGGAGSIDVARMRHRLALFERLAADDPRRFRVFDRRTADDACPPEQLEEWLAQVVSDEAEASRTA